MHHEVDQHGFAMVRSAISTTDVDQLLSALGPATSPGRRGLLALPVISELARSQHILGMVSPHLPARPFPVRTTYFDKSPDSNWLVA